MTRFQSIFSPSPGRTSGGKYLQAYSISTTVSGERLIRCRLDIDGEIRVGLVFCIFFEQGFTAMFHRISMGLSGLRVPDEAVGVQVRAASNLLLRHFGSVMGTGLFELALLYAINMPQKQPVSN